MHHEKVCDTFENEGVEIATEVFVEVGDKAIASEVSFAASVIGEKETEKQNFKNVRDVQMSLFINITVTLA